MWQYWKDNLRGFIREGGGSKRKFRSTRGASEHSDWGAPCPSLAPNENGRLALSETAIFECDMNSRGVIRS